jgi:hypothetical protein
VKIHDGQGIVDRLAGTGRFTGVVANPAADPGERMVLFKQLHGFRIFLGIDESDISLNAHMGRAGDPAGSVSPLGDGIPAGDSLGVSLISGLAAGQTFIIFVRQLYGTNLAAFTTAGALG